jgi:predicted 3-demethylubiquinone-9 3-methyltransferase (glyoxalase superfamily)
MRAAHARHDIRSWAVNGRTRDAALYAYAGRACRCRNGSVDERHGLPKESERHGAVGSVDCRRDGLNGGPAFKHNEAFSFQIATDDQQETDRYWNAIVGNGGQESQCGWCKDKWGVSWQITPRVLNEALAAGGDEAKLRV